MTDQVLLAEEVRRATSFQKTPEPIGQDEYIQMVINGIREQYIWTGRAASYRADLLDMNSYTYASDFGIDEQDFITISAQILFYEKVQTGVNTQVSYTTDALSVTKADMPYKNLSETIAKLEYKRRVIYYKMTAYVME